MPWKKILEEREKFINFLRCRYSYYVYLHVTGGSVQEITCIIRLTLDTFEKKSQKTWANRVFQVFLSKSLKKNLVNSKVWGISHLHLRKRINFPT